MQRTANILLITIQKNPAWSHSFACWGLPFLADFKALQVQTEQGDWASLEKICQIFSPRVIQLQPPKKQLRYPGVQVAPVKVNSINTKLWWETQSSDHTAGQLLDSKQMPGAS